MYLSDIIGKEQKITNSLTVFVAPPTPSKTASFEQETAVKHGSSMTYLAIM